MDDKDSLWLALALGRRRYERDSEVRLLSQQVAEALPGGQAEDLAKRFVFAGPGERIGVGVDLIHALIAEYACSRGDNQELIEFVQLLLACSGDRESAAFVATNLMREGLRRTAFDNYGRRVLLQAAIGWLAVASGKHDPKFDGKIADYAAELGYELSEFLTSNAVQRLRESEAERKKREESTHEILAEYAAEHLDLSDADAEAEAEHLVVVSAVAAGTGSAGKDIGSDFDLVSGVALPLTPTPDLAHVRNVLTHEFPHADAVIETVLADLTGRKSIRLRPTLLLGDPGAGKSRLARRLCEELGLKHAIYPCGGISDSSFAGTARKWSSTEPSMPLRLVRDQEVANPCIVLDELEKAGSSTHNGRLWDALIQLLEQETAARWEDPYIQAPCDLSAVIWIGTANSLDRVPEPLLDRIRILRVPSPTAEHLPRLASRLLRDLVRQRGLDSRWLMPLDDFEISALRRAWSGGSIRSLRRLLEGVLEARDQSAPRH